MINIKKIYEHPNGNIVEVKQGFSWTSLLFGVIVPIYRADLLGFVFQLFLAFLTGGLSWFIVPFFYNKRYEERLIEKGYILIKNI